MACRSPTPPSAQHSHGPIGRLGATALRLASIIGIGLLGAGCGSEGPAQQELAETQPPAAVATQGPADSHSVRPGHPEGRGGADNRRVVPGHLDAIGSADCNTGATAGSNFDAVARTSTPDGGNIYARPHANRWARSDTGLPRTP